MNEVIADIIYVIWHILKPHSIISRHKLRLA